MTPPCSTNHSLEYRNARALPSNLPAGKTINIPLEKYFTSTPDQLTPIIDDGMLEGEAKGIRVFNAGRLLVRRTCRVFDTYLQANNQFRYSRII